MVFFSLQIISNYPCLSYNGCFYRKPQWVYVSQLNWFKGLAIEGAVSQPWSNKPDSHINLSLCPPPQRHWNRKDKPEGLFGPFAQIADVFLTLNNNNKKQQLNWQGYHEIKMDNFLFLWNNAVIIMNDWVFTGMRAEQPVTHMRSTNSKPQQSNEVPPYILSCSKSRFTQIYKSQ